MATVNKSDRKKLVGTQIIGSVVVFQRVDTGEEIGRVDSGALAGVALEQTLVYGVKQIVSDIVASADGLEAKITGMQGAIASLNEGQWPRRLAAPVDMNKAIETMMKALGKTRAEVCTMLDIEA